MASKTLTISAPAHLLQFLDENPSISASKVFQKAVEDLQESITHNPQLIEALQLNQRKDKIIKQLQEFLREAADEIEKLKKAQT